MTPIALMTEERMSRRFPCAPRAFAAALAIFCAASTTARAQSPEHDAAYRVVQRVFDAMRARDTTAMRASFVPNAAMQRLGDSTVVFEPIDAWLGSVARARPGLVLDERLANAVVHVDGALASIWVDYWLFVGDRFSHCGVDAFLLVKQSGVWRIFSVVDTRRTEGCAAAPPR